MKNAAPRDGGTEEKDDDRTCEGEGEVMLEIRS